MEFVPYGILPMEFGLCGILSFWITLPTTAAFSSFSRGSECVVACVLHMSHHLMHMSHHHMHMSHHHMHMSHHHMHMLHHHTHTVCCCMCVYCRQCVVCMCLCVTVSVHTFVHTICTHVYTYTHTCAHECVLSVYYSECVLPSVCCLHVSVCDSECVVCVLQ